MSELRGSSPTPQSAPLDSWGGAVTSPATDAATVEFLADAHRHGHWGAVMLRRWAMRRNHTRRAPHQRITTEVLTRAVELEAEVSDHPMPRAGEAAGRGGPAHLSGGSHPRVRISSDSPSESHPVPGGPPTPGVNPPTPDIESKGGDT